MPTRGRPFEPGNTIGRGRPKGSRNKLTPEGRQILSQYYGPLMRKGISMALQGDPKILGLLLKLGLDAPAKPAKFGKVSMRTTDDLMKLSETVTQQWGAGKISTQEADSIYAIIEQHRKLIETHELAKSVRELEEKLKGNQLEDKAA